MYRLIYSPIAWILYLLIIEIPLILLGFPVIAIAAALKLYKQDSSTGYYHWTSSLMKIYDNPDDGIMDPGYGPYTSDFGKIFYWSAIRNPVDGLKYVPLICCAIDPNKVEFRGSLVNSNSGYRSSIQWQQDVFKAQVLLYDTKIPQWFFIWQGFYTGFYWQFNAFGGLYLFWIGWKMKPGDIYGVEKYRTPRAPSGIQFNRQV